MADHSIETAVQAAPGLHDINWQNPSDIDPAKLVAFVEEEYSLGKRRRLEWEKRAAEQLTWSRGNQDRVFSAEMQELAQSRSWELARRYPVRINTLRLFILHQSAMLFGRPLSFFVAPTTDDEEDVDASRLSAKVLRYYWEAGVETMTRRLLDAAWWIFGTGLCFGRVNYDPERGLVDSFKPEDLGIDLSAPDDRAKNVAVFRQEIAQLRGLKPEEIEIDEDGQYKLPRGDVVTRFISGFDITEPPGTATLDGCPWLIHTEWMSLEDLRLAFGSKADGIVAEPRSADSLGNYAQFGEGRDDELISDLDSRDQVRVHHFWRPVSRAARKGCYAVVAAGRVMKQGRNPFLHGRLPFVAIQECPDPERLRSGCTVRDLMTLQAARNRVRSMRLSHLMQTLDPKIAVEKGAEVPDNFFDPGPKVKEVGANAYSGRRFGPVEMPAEPGQASELEALLKMDFEDLGRIHANTQGRIDAGSQSGRAIALNQAQNLKAGTVTRLIVETSLSKLGVLQLMTAYQFLKQPALAVIAGDNQRHELFAFRGRDLSPKRMPVGPFEFNVRVTVGEEPNMQDVVAQMQAMTQMGYLNPMDAADRAFVRKRILDNYAGEIDPGSPHRANAERENQLLLAGKRVPVLVCDDDLEHERSHMAAMHKHHEEIQRRDDLRIAFELHAREHRMQAAQRAVEIGVMGEAMKLKLAAQWGLLPAAGAGPQPETAAEPAAPEGGPRLAVA